MVAEDKKGRMAIRGVDIQRKDAVGREYFLVLIRATQGHRKNIANN